MAFPTSDQNMNRDSTKKLPYPTWDEFVVSYFRQCFSLPDSVIYYIMKNPRSSKVYQKLIQSCKHFYIKNPILVIHCFQIDDDGWKICLNDCENRHVDEKANVSIKTLARSKIWIQDRLRIFSTNSKCASDFIGRIYQCDAEKLQLCDQHISLEQFLFCTRHAKRLSLRNVVINSDAYSEMPLDEIVANLPKMERFTLEFGTASRNVTSSTVAKLLQIPHFKNIAEISLQNVSEEFDIDVYYKYYKNLNTKICFYFHYDNQLSEEYVKKLELINNEILDMGLSDRLTSAIMYPGQDEKEQDALLELFDKSLKYFG